MVNLLLEFTLVGWVEERSLLPAGEPNILRGLLGNVLPQPNLQIFKTYAVLNPFLLFFTQDLVKLK